MKALTPVQCGILEIASEDYIGLWEAVAIVKSKSTFAREAQSQAHDILEELLSRHLLEAFEGVRFWGEERQLSFQEALELLDDQEQWDPDVPIGRRYMRVAATSLGEESLRLSLLEE